MKKIKRFINLLLIIILCHPNRWKFEFEKLNKKNNPNKI